MHGVECERILQNYENRNKRFARTSSQPNIPFSCLWNFPGLEEKNVVLGSSAATMQE